MELFHGLENIQLSRLQLASLYMSSHKKSHLYYVDNSSDKRPEISNEVKTEAAWKL